MCLNRNMLCAHWLERQCTSIIAYTYAISHLVPPCSIEAFICILSCIKLITIAAKLSKTCGRESVEMEYEHQMHRQFNARFRSFVLLLILVFKCIFICCKSFLTLSLLSVFASKNHHFLTQFVFIRNRIVSSMHSFLHSVHIAYKC